MGIPSAAVAAPTDCASCVFGAYSSTILSFTSSYIEHITVSVTPHISVYNNGSRSTSFESNTLTKSAIVGGIAGSNSSKTYARKSDIQWTVDGATLTYPTKYVQYLGFKGAPAPTDNGDTCAEETEASEISLPATTDAASFIYALPANATALALPTPLLQYLGGLDDLVDQFDGAALTGCASLGGGGPNGGSGSGWAPHVGGNGSAIAPSGYASASNGGAIETLPVGTGGLSPSTSGYAGSSDAWPAPYSSMRPTGYSTKTTSITPEAPSSSSSCSSEVAKSSSTSPSSLYITPSSPSSSSAEISSPATTTSGYAILPHPYLNTTTSRSSTSSQTSTSGYVDITSTRTSTFTAPGGIFLPSDLPNYNEGGVDDNGGSDQTATASPPKATEAPQTETSMTAAVPTSTGGSSSPPRPGGNAPQEVPPEDGDDGADDGSPPRPGGNAPQEVPPEDGDDGADEGGDGSLGGKGDAGDSPPPPPAESYDTSATEEPTTTAYMSMPTDEGENVHTTAFVIEPITGPALITYESDPAPAAGGGGGHTSAPTETGVAGLNGAAPGGYGDVTKPEQTAAPDVSNLLDGIGAVANGEVHNADGGSGAGSGSGAQSGGAGNIGGSLGSGDDSAGGAEGYHGAGSANSPGQQGPGGSIAGSNGGASNAAGQSNSGQDSEEGQSMDLASAIIIVANDQAGEGTNPGSQATPPANADSHPAPVYSGDNTVISAQPGGVVVIGEQIVAPGHSVTVGSGSATTVVALQTNAGNTHLVIGGSTIQAQPPSSAVTAQPNGAVVFGGSTVQPGQSVTIGSGPSATVVALQTNNAGSANLVVGENTMPVRPAVTATPGAVTDVSAMALITTNGQTITAVQSGSNLILQSGASTVTASPGAAATFGGATVLAVPNEQAIFVNGNITPLTAAQGVQAASQAIITAANGHTLTALDAGNSLVLVDGAATTTLPDGAAATWQGQTISAPPRGVAAVVINGHTRRLTSAIAFATGQAVLTADSGDTFSALDLPGYVVLRDGASSVTLRDGATATFAGETVTALPGGEAVLVDGVTMRMTAAVDLASATAVVTAKDGGTAFTVLDMEGYVILRDGKGSSVTVRDGATTVFEGQTVRALAGGSGVVVGGHTVRMTGVGGAEATATATATGVGVGAGGDATGSETADAAAAGPTGAQVPEAEGNEAGVLVTSRMGVVLAGVLAFVAVL